MQIIDGTAADRALESSNPVGLIDRLAVRLATATLGVLLVAGPASAATLGGTAPAPIDPRVSGSALATPRVSPTPLPSLPPNGVRLLDLCPTSRGAVAENQIRPACSGTAPRVDETYTILGNTVLQRTCGRFITHVRGGNAALNVVDQVITQPGAAPITVTDRGDGWVLALRGCNLDRIASVVVAGGGVTTSVIPASAITAWRVPLATAVAANGSTFDAGAQLAGGNQVAFVRFRPATNAHFHEDRALSITWKPSGGSTPATQKLKKIKLALADNGSVSSLTVKVGNATRTHARWEEESTVQFAGTQLRRARLRAGEGGCLKAGTITSNAEASLRITGTFDCPVVVPEADGTQTIVTAPHCACTMLAYDSSLDVYRDAEIAKEQFNYLGRPVNVFANLDKMNEKPAALGDSLSHGVMGAGLAPRSQLWAYPHLVLRQMGGRPLRQNLFYLSNIEDNVKGAFAVYPHKYGLAADENFEHATLAGFIDENEQIHLGGMTTAPLHVGVDGFDYTNVLYTSGRRLDVRGGTRWRESVQHPRCACPEFCNEDGTPKEGVDTAELPTQQAQLALGCGDRSAMQIIEAEKPTFIFATAGNNHVLACATKMMAQDDCLERERFERDATETFRRLRKIGSIKGGIVFGIPPLDSIPYFASNGDGTLRAFWRRSSEATGDARVLSAAERAEVNEFIADANAFLRRLAETNQYAFADSTAGFTRLQQDGEPIFEGSKLVCSAKTVTPTEIVERGPNGEPQNAGVDAGCGIIGPDGAHPTQLGHAVMTNELVRAINAFYRLDVDELTRDEIFAAWSDDSLNQDPIDMKDLMTGNHLGECGPTIAAVAAACAVTGGFCLGPVVAAAVATGAGETCVTAVAQHFARDSFEHTMEETVEPQVCWPDAEHDYAGC